MRRSHLDAPGEVETNWDEVVETFDAMDLKEELLRGIYAYGFEKPSAIQQVSSDPLKEKCIVRSHGDWNFSEPCALCSLAEM